MDEDAVAVVCPARENGNRSRERLLGVGSKKHAL